MSSTPAACPSFLHGTVRSWKAYTDGPAAWRRGLRVADASAPEPVVPRPHDGDDNEDQEEAEEKEERIQPHGRVRSPNSATLAVEAVAVLQLASEEMLVSIMCHNKQLRQLTSGA
ncbi:hypothetical protein AK812_SmicGene8279 [Symbiodinium microadriaticum]|uniref:Uncharacterized protein n=1 Tax=Symbiodinium microadriaticum TaxID=2951 RepID=A0A1Q9ELG6_SYMMI|nr:hypothetical protein AK812_SmicGene8279 [Symbiodinium microadriaticum]